jgi:hypothetical protein
MTEYSPSPAKRTFRVWADDLQRVFQEIEAASPREAYELACDDRDNWRCDEQDSNDLRVSTEVQDIETDETFAVEGYVRCRACGSEIVESINDSKFREGECGPCEYERYTSQPALVALAQSCRDECTDRIAQLLREDCCDADDLRDRIAHWKALRKRCDDVLRSTHGHE